MLKKIFTFSLLIIINHSISSMELSARRKRSSLKDRITSPIKERLFRSSSTKDLSAPKEEVNHNFLPQKELINQTDNVDGDTNLIYAAKNGLVTRVRRLLQEENIDINAQNFLGLTALHCAAIKKDTTIIDLLLKDPRTQAFITTTDGLTARELIHIDTIDDTKLRSRLFARTHLEEAVLRVCPMIKRDFQDQWEKKTITADSQCIEDAVKGIDGSIPDYIGKDFAKTMMMLYLYKQ